MSRVIFLGIDGLDSEFLTTHLDDLPTLKRLAGAGVLVPLPSVFPPDSIPAWITIFTGEEPAEHGIIESIDYLARHPADATREAPSYLRGRTFWDAISDAGKKVCVINPFMAYPAWPVRGTMISGPVFVNSSGPSMEPERFVSVDELPQLGGIVDFPTPKTMRAFYDRTLATTVEQCEFALRLWDELEPDFLFLNVLTIDRIQHFLWRYSDPDDPTYPGPGPLQSAIADAYGMVDELVGRFADRLDDDDVLILASDHGHGQRCSRMVFLDEFFRREGLVSLGSKQRAARTWLIERAKRVALATAYRTRMEEQAYRLARHVPGKRALKTSSYSVREGSLVRTSRMFGRNSSGGVDIAAGQTEQDRKELVDRVCVLLRDLTDPETGQRVVLWARPREEVLSGRHTDHLPDVVFQLKPQYGTDFGVLGPVFGRDFLHRRISGGHRPDGVFASTRSDLPLVPKRLSDLYALTTKLALGDSA
jgi:predicted AlkP superfamily phosphohydrolase/phosphomutase